MCGISAIINNDRKLETAVFERFRDMAGHRGPDGCGASFFDEKGVLIGKGGAKFRLGLGHRRLSIIDLSESASQPMTDEENSLVIVYNGEIYNYIEIRKELEAEGVCFRTHSDTEVLLKAYGRWGEKCLSKFNGMWAFVIYDKKQKKLFISRDRIGVKPLYFWKDGANLAIASEIKQFFQIPSFTKKVNIKSLLLYLASGYEDPPETFFEGVYAFPPAHFAKIAMENPEINPQRFWEPEKILPLEWEDKTAVSRIFSVFSDAVRLRLRSDVPVGGCLSGGLDSSAIFVLMKELQAKTSFYAFSACFEDKAIDERPFMEEVVRKTGGNHIKVFPSGEDFVNDFQTFLKQHDEPVGSASIYAQYLVMKKARELSVPVLLDGQGGDELFSGYWPSYMLMMNGCRREGKYFSLALDLAAACMPGGNGELISQVVVNYCEFRKRRGRIGVPFSLRNEFKGLLEGGKVLKWHEEALSLSPEEYRKAEIFRIHLPRLLKWEDRNSMAFSIESRTPFLDVNLVELLLSIPPQMNMRRGWTKYLFRKALDGKLPDSISWRKDKKGFETPQEKWMRARALHLELLEWTANKDHPIENFVDVDFCEIRNSLTRGNFNVNALFRLYCADKWMELF